MIIKEKDYSSISISSYSIISNRKKIILIFILFLLISASSITLILIIKGNNSFLIHPDKNNLLPIMEIEIKELNYQKLAYQRENALKLGFLINSGDDFVPAKITFNNSTVKVDIRLKGDMVSDHLGTDKWSFRVDVKGDNTVLGMKIFNIQNPVTRIYLNEWLWFAACKKEGLITLRYDFVNVKINGTEKGVYAIEEGFEKRLIENNHFREGPIISLNEDWFWKGRADNNPLTMESFSSTDVDTFQTNKTVSDPTLYQEFLFAKDMLNSVRVGKIAPDNVFDIDKTSRLLALSVLFGGTHGPMAWENQRFYYNPITSLLEPIPFDGNTGQNIDNLNTPIPFPWYFKPKLFFS